MNHLIMVTQANIMNPSSMNSTSSLPVSERADKMDSHEDSQGPFSREALKAITKNNSSTPLLKLPREIRDQIYELVCGGQLLHIGWTKGHLIHRICRAEISEQDAEDKFLAEATARWSMGEIEDRHKDCFADKKHAEMISTSSLAICRQVHNEARNMFYTTNTFAFSQITNINQFVNYLQNSGCGHHLVIRRVHLKIMIERFHDEKDWKIAITQCLILRLPAVHRISINLTLLYSTANVVVSRTPAEFEARQLPGDSGNNLMSALLELGKLPLSRMTFVMSKRWFYCWTLAEKQTWARYIKDSVLRKDNQT